TTTGSVPLDRHVALLPGGVTFWLQLLVGNIGMLVGVAVWTFQRTNVAARHLCTTGVGLAISTIAAAIYSSRSIALDGSVFEFLSYANFFGVLLFSAGFLCMMWNYPGSLAKFPITPFWYGLMALIFCADYFGWLESLDLLRRLPSIVTLLASIIVLALQWKKSHEDPLIRQSLLWFVFVTLSGSTIFALAILVPPLFDRDLIISQGVAFVAFLTIYIGLAVGVGRYPLFDLQQYWVKALIWLAGGLAVIVLNLIIASTLGLSNETVVIMFMASVAAVVLPLRALGARYMMNQATRNFQAHLPKVVAGMSKSLAPDAESIWAHEIEGIFQPLEIKEEQVAVIKPVVVKRGLGFVVPGMVESVSYHLVYADGGTRLFNSLDVTLIETLQSLFKMNVASRQTADEVRIEERGRIKQDLHDTLGGRLLSIIHSAPDESVASESRQALAEMREILTSIDESEALFADALQAWEQQLRDQAAGFNSDLIWRVNSGLSEAGLFIPGRDRLHLGRIFRELVTNAVRHAGARVIEVDVSLTGDDLGIEFSNDGDVGSAEHWQSGNGLINLKARTTELGGDISWKTGAERASFRLRVPIHDWRSSA
ncbi:MAG: hypothetical protein HOE54_11750, partial [Gammaproteobacteria bacterium]|nr:hypothetical protein [Gammaproteobacteria bacterium]